MARGSKICLVRLPPELLARVEERIKSRNENSRETPWTLSEYIRYTIGQDLAHRRRSNPRRKPNAEPQQPPLAPPSSPST